MAVAESTSGLDTTWKGRVHETHHQHVGKVDDDGFGDAISLKPKYLVSNTVTGPAWQDTSVLSGDVAAAIRDLKARPGGDPTVVGSGSLATWLLRNDLVDEIDLIVFPVVIGEGRRLFPERGPAIALGLTDHRVFPTGIAAHTYRVSGRPDGWS